MDVCTLEQEDHESPPIQITSLTIKNASLEKQKIFEKVVHVVREDLLPGGTKQRAAIPFLRHFQNQGYTEFVYASPFCGFAQFALAQAALTLGVNVTVFCEARPRKSGELNMYPHELSRACEAIGARLVLCKNLAEAEEQALQYCAGQKAVFKIPLGFNHQVFLNFYRQKISLQFSNLEKLLGRCPGTIWLPIGSGTLARVFRSVVPQAVILKCVDVHVLGANDLRLQTVRQMPHVLYFSAPLPFSAVCPDHPPVPSNAYYDAKLWSFIKDSAQDGDVWWNVAR